MACAPCKNCAIRYLGCHSECDKYKEFKNEIVKETEIKNKERMFNDYYGPKHLRAKSEYFKRKQTIRHKNKGGNE